MGNFYECANGSGIVKINGNDVGYIEGAIKVAKKVETIVVENGVPRTKKGTRVTKETFELEAAMLQLNPTNLQTVLGITPVVVAAAEVDKTATWESLTFAEPTGETGLEIIKLGPTANMEQWVTISDGADVPIIGTNVAIPVPYTENDDYVVNYDTGKVYRNPGGAIGAGEVVKVKYKYTPPASTQFNFGATTSLPTFEAEFIFEDPQTGTKVTAYMPKAEANPEVEWSFDEKFILTNAKISAVYDETRTLDKLGYLRIE